MSDKLKKNGGKGTNVGNALRWLAKQGKTIAPEILNIASNITGVGSLEKLSDLISGDTKMDVKDKDLLKAEILKDIAVEQELTKRWVSDNQSQDWLPRNVRPIVVLNFTALIDYVILTAIHGRPIEEQFLGLLITMGTTTIGGYFALREYGKTKNK